MESPAGKFSFWWTDHATENLSVLKDIWSDFGLIDILNDTESVLKLDKEFDKKKDSDEEQNNLPNNIKLRIDGKLYCKHNQYFQPLHPPITTLGTGTSATRSHWPMMSPSPSSSRSTPMRCSVSWSST
jgi:hypothetical protein